MTVPEVESLRSIENVIRLGHLVSVGNDELSFERGTVPNDGGQVFVDCSAPGLGKAHARPIFEPERITLQCVSSAFPTFNAAVIGFIEATRSDDHEAKASLTPTNRYPDTANDWIPNMRGQIQSLDLWNAQPDLAAWLRRAASTSPAG